MAIILENVELELECQLELTLKFLIKLKQNSNRKNGFEKEQELQVNLKQSNTC